MAREIILHLYNSRLARTLFVGAIAVTVQTAVFEVVAIWLGLVSPSTGTIIGAEAGILTNFFLNNKLSFHDRRADGVTLHRIFRFHLVVSGSVFIQWLFVFIAENVGASLFTIHVAYASGIVLGFVWNYNWYRLWVWRHKEDTQGSL